MKKKKVIGIDLGTTYSEMAHVTQSGAVEVIPNSDGDLKTPSVASVASGKVIIGKAALPDFVLAPQFTARCFKRFMNRNAENDKPIPLLFDPSGREWTAVDFSAAVVGHLKGSAEQYLGVKVESAVITVPAYFTETGRNNTKAAGQIVGFHTVELLDEPVAAALSYGLEKGRDETIVVVDSGGGTTDVTAMEVSGKSTRVIVTDGDSELGGSNYDEAIFAVMCEQARANGIEISAEKDLATFNQNLDRAREGKEMLSRREEVTLVAEAEGKRVPIKFTRQMLAEAGRPLDERFIHCCKSVADELHSRGKRIDRVLLVGGNCRQPHVAEMVQTVFGLEPSKDADPDLVVAKGAAIWAAVCFGSKGQTVAVGERRYLASEIEMKTVAAHAICVAARRDKNDPTEYNCVIVPANTPLPHEFEERFAPVNPGSPEVVVKIVQGQKDEPSENCPLLRKVTVPIRPSDNDENRIKLKGRYTEEGLLELTVVDDLLGRPISDSFVYKAGLSDAEIDQKRRQLRKDMGDA
jgi:molecular chaperone DnaK